MMIGPQARRQKEYNRREYDAFLVLVQAGCPATEEQILFLLDDCPLLDDYSAEDAAVEAIMILNDPTYTPTGERIKNVNHYTDGTTNRIEKFAGKTIQSFFFPDEDELFDAVRIVFEDGSQLGFCTKELDATLLVDDKAKGLNDG